MKNIGVLFGSRSCEHEVSIISAVQLMRNVNSEKYKVIPVYISQDGNWYTGDILKEIKTYTPFDPYREGIKRVQLDLTANSGSLVHYEHAKGLFGGIKEEVVARLDCVIPVFHGLHGEDGTIQGLLELANIPYTSSGILGSALGMDKIAMKTFFRGCAFPVLDGFGLTRSEWQTEKENSLEKIHALGWPVFVKPACLGSSIGVGMAADDASLQDALELAFSYDRRVLIEKGLDRPAEVNCAVLGFDNTLDASVLEMPNTGKAGFLDFSDKYLNNGSSKGMASLKRLVPAPISDELTHALQDLSKQVFRALDCKGVVRIDYMLDHDNTYYITEINTIPGSMAYYLWEASGLKYPDMIDKMIEYALQAKEEKEKNNYAFSSDILKGVSLNGKNGKFGKGKL